MVPPGKHALQAYPITEQKIRLQHLSIRHKAFFFIDTYTGSYKEQKRSRHAQPLSYYSPNLTFNLETPSASAYRSGSSTYSPSFNTAL